jgi:hypothetical protein
MSEDGRIELARRCIERILSDLRDGADSPVAFVVSRDSEPQFVRFVGREKDDQSLVEDARRSLNEDPEVEKYALAWSSHINIDGAHSEAIIIEAEQRGHLQGLKLAQRLSRGEGALGPVGPMLRRYQPSRLVARTDEIPRGDVIASCLGTVGAMARSGPWLFLAAWDAQAILRAPVDGSEPPMVFIEDQNRVSALAIQGPDIYWLCDGSYDESVEPYRHRADGAIHRAPLDGTRPAETVVSGLIRPRQLVVGPGTLLWGAEGGIYAWHPQRPEPRRLFDLPNASELSLVGDDLYVSAYNQGLLRLPLQGTPETLARYEDIVTFVVRDGSVWLARSPAPSRRTQTARLLRLTAGREEVVAELEHAPAGLAVDDVWLWFTCFAKLGGVWRVRREGGRPELVAQSSGPPAHNWPGKLLVCDDRLLWETRGNLGAWGNVLTLGRHGF